MSTLLNKALHPQKSYREFRDWRTRQSAKYVVQIENPPMKIKGKAHPRVSENPLVQKTFFAFLGVPYAEPPIDSWRFQPPRPLQARPGPIQLFKAYRTVNACLQFNPALGQYRGDEDCLYLNIYMKEKPSEMPSGMPVLVFIHGGGFARGSGDLDELTPDAIVKENLVFVTVNYRLDILGFLNMGTENCRGNAGLKDQVQALRWIKANIDKFGGDPNNVTISGHSAGGTCVNLHMISPLSKGLFHKAIVQAGGIYCPWGFQKNQNKLRRLFTREYRTGNNMRHLLVETLKRENAVTLLEVTNRIVSNMFAIEAPKLVVHCGPSEEDEDAEGAFIPGKVEDLMMVAEPVPLIAGIAQLEGYMQLLADCEHYPDGFHKLVRADDQFTSFLAHNLNWSNETARKNLNAIRKRYFMKKMTFQEIQDNLAALITDIWYSRFFDNFKFGGTLSPLYVYKFCYMRPISSRRYNEHRTIQLILGGVGLYIYKSKDTSSSLSSLKSPTHGDELTYLYSPKRIDQVAMGVDRVPMKEIMKHMCRLWGNFCRTGYRDTDCRTYCWRWKVGIGIVFHLLSLLHRVLSRSCSFRFNRLCPHIESVHVGRERAPDKSHKQNTVWTAHTEAKPCYFRIDERSFMIPSDYICGSRGQFLSNLISQEPTVESRSSSPDSQFNFCRVERLKYQQKWASV